jgi:predicted Zn finger-like uncharacterized protein
MAVSKLTCPECETVLRPAKPLAAGKRVKCPRCGTTFTAQGDDEDELEPQRAAKKDSPKKKKEDTEQPKSSGIEYETSTYAVIKDNEEEEQEEKEERGDELVAEFLKVKKTKDPRGPALEMVTKPSNYMIITGTLGAVAYGILLLLFFVIYLMPPPNPERLDDDSKGKAAAAKKFKGLTIEPSVSAIAGSADPAKKEEEEKKKKGDEGGGFMDKLAFISAMAWSTFILLCSLFLIGIIYCAFVIYGAVKIQNLASRGWGFASSILVMIPLTGLGFMGITVSLARLLFEFLYGDPTIVFTLVIAVIVIEVGWGVLIGIWNIKTLMDPAVVAGYEYIEEQQVTET